MKLLRFPLVAMSFALTAGGVAQAAPQLDTIVVTQRRIDAPITDSVRGGLVLRPESFAPYLQASLADGLNGLPGVTAFEKGGPGGGSYISLRGGEPNFTLMLINGVRVNDPMTSAGGSFDLSLLDPATITSAHVIQGPQSTVYGADALAGLVDIRFGSMAVQQPDVRASLLIGGDDRWRATSSVRATGSAGTVLIAGGGEDTGTWHAGSTLSRQQIVVAFDPRLGPSLDVNLFALASQSDSKGFPEDSGGPQLAALPDLESRDRSQLVAGLHARAALAPALSGSLRMGWSRSTLDSRSPGIAPGLLDGVPPLTTDSRFQRFDLTAEVEARPIPALSLAAGASYIHEKGHSDGFIDFGVLIPTSYRQSRSLPGLHAAAQVAGPFGSQLSAGLRADFPSGGKSRITPRAGLTVPVAGGWSFIVSGARGFKQPSLFALGFPLIANPNLRDERSAAIEGGVTWRNDKGDTVSVIAYRTRYRDLIDFDPALFTNVNRNAVVAKGVDITAEARPTTRLTVSAAVSHMTIDSADGATLRFRPRWKANASARWQVLEPLMVGARIQLVSDRLDQSIPTGLVELDGFSRVDAFAQWRIGQVLTAGLALTNLTDSRYSQTIGTPEPGRTVTGTIQLSF